MRKLLFTFLCLGQILNAQYENVQIGISNRFDLGPCEPSISINPTNPKNIVAGAILDKVYYSNDSGKTWEYTKLESSYGVWGDPVIISDHQGVHYFFHLSDPTGRNWRSEEILDRIVVQKSSDGGKTWNNGSYMGFNHPKDQDKQWAVVDKSNGNIYATWTQFDKYDSRDTNHKSNIMFSVSTDGSNTWTKAKAISQITGDCLDGDSTTEGAVPAVGPNGEVYVAWSNQEKIYFDRSFDFGASFMENDFSIADHVGGWVIDVPGLNRSNGMPVTVCDVSTGEHRGSIYVNWVDNRNGHYDVWLIKSTDKGETWSEPIKVNDDSKKRDQFLTWMACDPVTGYLYCVFYDRRNHRKLKTDVYLAYSQDGGETWVNAKISDSPFTPDANVFFGDYNDIDAYNGTVRPIWTRYEKGKLSVWTALIQF